MKHTMFKSIFICFLVFACCLFLLAGGMGLAQDDNTIKIGKETKDFAKKALDDYVQNYLSQENVGRFGFKTIGQAKDASLGEPIKMMQISLEKLRAYQRGMRSMDVLSDAHTLWYPVLVQNMTTSKLEIIKKEGRLIAGEFGKSKTARQVSEVREKVARLIAGGQVKEAEEEFLVEVPFFRALFIYIKNADGEHMVPAMIQPERFGLENGVIYPAGKVLHELAEMAAQIEKEKIIG